jgi:outer membrane receptor protein involved in Fe transport
MLHRSFDGPPRELDDWSAGCARNGKGAEASHQRQHQADPRPDAPVGFVRRHTTADAFAFIDIPKSPTFPTLDNTRVTFRVRNLTDRRYAEWSDPSYPDQIFLGAPRTYEIETSFKF